jgi:uncharacterized protein (DUF488 family)
MKLYTIGHSTRSLDELVDVLKTYGIEQLIDVRSVPRSRHTPQFNEDNLVTELPKIGIDYRHMRILGGLRYAHKDSANIGWHNASFRGYADYMQTTDFASGIAELEKIAQSKSTAIMCAEVLPWRCHRSMIGDAMLVRGHEVIDIYDDKKSEPEKITSFAHIEGTMITYPSDQPER